MLTIKYITDTINGTSTCTERTEDPLETVLDYCNKRLWEFRKKVERKEEEFTIGGSVYIDGELAYRTYK